MESFPKDSIPKRVFFFNLIHKVELPYSELKWAGNHRHLRKIYINFCIVNPKIFREKNFDLSGSR